MPSGLPPAPPASAHSFPDLLIFNAQPGATLLLSPEWVILGASDDYLAATLTDRATIVGRYIFDAFPDNPDLPEADGVAKVRASLEQVLATKQPHDMAPQHYDVPDPAHPGQFVERHWQPRHTPVLDAAGQVRYILQSVQDITAHRLAERQLRDSQAGARAAHAEAEQQRQRFREVLQQLPAYVAAYHGPDHVYQFVNPPYQSLFPHRAFEGRSYRDAMPEATGLGVVALFDRVYQTGEPYFAREMEGWFDFQDTGQPEQVFLNVYLQPLRNAQGHIDGVLDYSHNVTEQVRSRQQVEQLNAALETRVQQRTQEALALQAEVLAVAQRQAHERESFYQVFEQTAAVVALLRAPGHRYEYVNPAYQAFFPGRQLVGREVADAVPELIEQGFGALLDHVYRTGETFFGTELLFTPAPAPGQPACPRYFNFTYQAYREAGEIAGISIFAYDVTEQVEARRQREAEQQRRLDLFQEAPAGVCILAGPDLVFEFANPRYQLLLPERELVGRPILDALPELAGSHVIALLHQVYATGETHEEQGALAPITPAGGGAPEDRYFTFVYQARRNERAEVDGVQVFAFEVSEQVVARQQAQALAAELAASNEQLTRTNVDLDNFIYTASHDLKAPISNIEGLLYLLQHELPAAVAQGETVAPTLARMLDAVERFTRTIGHLTEVSKLQKEHAPATDMVDLAAVVEDVRQDLAPQLQATGAKLFIDVSALPPVQFSEKNLRSLVYNLLSNAVKYHSPDRPPRVDVRAHVRPDHTVLEVHDNGLGMAPAQLPKLFTMFQRFHDHVDGTGIGLYMVKKMVENAGGRIEVHSQLGAGTTFFVFLPHDVALAGAPSFPAYLPS